MHVADKWFDIRIKNYDYIQSVLNDNRKRPTRLQVLFYFNFITCYLSQIKLVKN